MSSSSLAYLSDFKPDTEESVIEPVGAGPHLVALPTPEFPRVLQHKDLQVLVSSGQELPRGTWVLMGCDHIGIVTSHREDLAVVRLLCEKGDEGWGQIRHPVPIGDEVSSVPLPVWEEIQQSRFKDRFPIGTIRQPNCRPTAYVPLLNQHRLLLVGQSGSGKSSARQTMLVNWRLSLKRQGHHPLPGLLCLDLHGDDLGRVTDDQGVIRPSLVSCFPAEEIEIIDSTRLQCTFRDLPAPLLLDCIPKLSGPQARWRDLYVVKNTSHDAIAALLNDDSDWNKAFPELQTESIVKKNGQMFIRKEITRQVRESLSALRSKLKAVLSAPLFRDPKDPVGEGKIHWNIIFQWLMEGKVVIVDVADFPENQQNLLVVLLIRSLMARQWIRQRSKQPIHPVVITGDEIHLLHHAGHIIEKLFLEGRKLRIGGLFGSQELTHFSKSVISGATGGIVLRSEDATVEAVCRKWPQARQVAEDIRSLRNGSAFYFFGGSAPWPVDVWEAAPEAEYLRKVSKNAK